MAKAGPEAGLGVTSKSGSRSGSWTPRRSPEAGLGHLGEAQERARVVWEEESGPGLSGKRRAGQVVYVGVYSRSRWCTSVCTAGAGGVPREVYIGQGSPPWCVLPCPGYYACTTAPGVLAVPHGAADRQGEGRSGLRDVGKPGQGSLVRSSSLVLSPLPRGSSAGQEVRKVTESGNDQIAAGQSGSYTGLEWIVAEEA